LHGSIKATSGSGPPLIASPGRLARLGPGWLPPDPRDPSGGPAWRRKPVRQLI